MFVVSSPRQRSLLTSPLRLEILEQFAVATVPRGDARKQAEWGGASIAEIARAMGRRPDSLYHHVRLLAKFGLLVEAGTRKAGKRDETLYRPVAQSIAMPCDPSKPSSVDATVATVASMFRLAEREMRAGLSGGAAVPEGKQRNIFTRRVPAHLSASALKEINRHIDAILAIAERAWHTNAIDAADAVPVSITIALLPMTSRQRARRSAGGSPTC